MLSSMSLIVMLLVMIIVPTILYTFFFLIHCPSNPFRFLRRNYDVENTRSKISNEEDDEDNDSNNKDKNSIEMVATSNETLGKDVECSVCLSVFIQGEELKQLKTCKHMFHKSCIDKWLSTQCNCPVCRAFVGNHAKQMEKKEVSNRVLVARDVDRHDLWQGLPDSAGLV